MAAKGRKKLNPSAGGDPFAGLKAAERMVANITSPSEAPIRFAGLALVGEMVRTLSQPGTGREYPRGEKVHRASAPGQPPAVDQGELRASIGMELWAAVLRVGTGLPKGEGLEFGMTTPTGGVVAPRPWARPAFARARASMGQVLVGELRKATKRLASTLRQG